MKILIVEDNRDSRNLLSKQLRAFGYETITADNGVEALKQALKDTPDIIVSDIQMPVMDGYQLCRELKQNDKLKDIPVVFYTATYTTQEDEKFALNLGAAAFIRKPTEPDVLAKILSEIIEKAGSGLLSPPEVKPLEQYEYLAEHNKRLVTKLQKKIDDLNLEISEHKKAEDELKASEERLRSTLDAMMEGYQIIGNDYRYLYINPVAAAQGRYDRNKYYGHTMMELYPGIEKTDIFHRIQKCMKEKQLDRIDNEFTYPDGSTAWFDTYIEPIPEGVVVLSVDISKRKEAESDVLRINRMLRTISECNQLLVRATDEKELLEKICDLIVNSEGYPMVWVGFAENDEEKTVRPVALAGIASGYLDNLKVSWADNEFGRGPAGIAIRTGKLCIARHGTADSDYPRWRASAAKYGFNASIALPLVSNGSNIGSLNIYAKDTDAFNEEQVKLLQELADDLANGISVLRRRHELAIATANIAYSEKKYSTLVERSNDGIIVIQDGEIKFANQQVLKMTGFSIEETIGKKLLDFVSPAYVGVVIDRYKRRMAGEDVINRYEVEIVGRKNNYIPVEVNASIIEHEGRPGDMAIIRDITERKKADEALKESEAKYRLLVENIPVGVAIMCGNKILFANIQNEQMSGYTIEELKSLNPFDIIYKEDRVRVIEYAAMRARGESAPDNYDVRIIHKDGSMRWLRRSVVRIDWLGEKASLIIDSDITERKKAEEALKESEAKYRLLVENIPVGVVIMRGGKIIYANSQGEQLSGYTVEELKSLTPINVIYEEDRGKVTEYAAMRARGEPAPSSYDVRIIHKDGSLRWLRRSVVLIDWLGEKALLIIDSDVTERKKAEEALKNSESFLNNIIEYTPNPMWISDSSGTIIRINQALRDLLKITDESVIGKYNVLKDTQVIEQGLIPLVKTVLNKGKTVSFTIDYDTEKEKQIESDEKIHKILEIVMSVIKDDDGRIVNVICQHKDVTAQRWAEEALKESEERYRNFAESTHEIIQSIGTDGSILFVNKAWHDILGYSEEDLKKITLADIVHSDSLEHCSDMLREVLSGKSIPFVEARFKKKDGSVIYVEGSAAPKFLGNKVIATQGFYTDVTERKKAEEALKQEKEYAQNIVNTAQTIILTLDTKGRIVDFNPYLEKISGYSLKEVRGKNWLNTFIPERNRRKIEKLFSTAIGDRKTTGNIDVIVTKSGEERFIEWYDTAIKDADGNITGLLAVGQDITERKKAEEAMLASETRYRRLFEAAKDGILIINSETGLIFDVNPFLINLLGLTKEDFIGKELWEIGIFKDIVANQSNFKELLQQGYIRYEDLPLKTHDGRQVDVEFVSNVYEVDHSKVIQCNIRDITERKKAEQALKDEAIRRRILIEQSRDGIVILNQDGGVYEVNQRFADMLGYSLSEVLKLHAWDWDYLTPRDQLLELFRKADEKGAYFETKHRRKDGSIYDVEISTNGAIFAGQKLIFCVCRDVTERKKAEDELRESQHLFSTVANTSPALVWMSGTDKLCNWFNEPWLNFTGRTLEQEMGNGWTEGVHPDDLAGCVNTYIQAFDNRQPFSMEYRLRNRNGEYRWIIDKGTPRFDAKGNFMGYIGSCIDITERKKAEVELKQASNVINRSRMVAFVWRNEAGWPVDFVTENAERVFGYSAKEFTSGKVHYADIVYPDDLAKVDKEVTDYSKNLAVTGYEHTPYRVITKAGNIIWVSDKTEIIRDENGAVKYYQGVIEDITERREAEERVIASESQFRTLFDTMSQGVILWNRDAKIISTNPAAEHIFGLTLKQMKDQTLMDLKLNTIREDGSLFTKDDHPSSIALKTGKPVKDVVIGFLNHKEKQYRWIVVSSIPQFKNGEKIPYQVYATFTDITKIRNIEEELIQSESKLRESLDSWETTFNSINNAICLLTLDGTIIRCNQAMNEIVEKSGGEIIGEQGFKLVYRSEKYIENRLQLKMIESGHREAGEIYAGDRWYYIIVDPIFGSEGKITGSVHTMEDITERKKMAERMVMTDRLASIGELSSGIAHELNNPLTSVIGIIQLLMERNDIPDDILKDLQLVNSEGQRAARVVKNLLVFARKHPNEAQLASVNQAVEKVLELRAYDQKVSNIEVIKDFAADLPQVEMDYFQIQQVFLNIVINAEFAMKEAHNGGTLVIKTELAGDMVRVSFKDDGPGIPKENLKRIFNPFFTTKEVGKGTGLGLSICHGIISQHHGNIYAESEFGKGATFVVELPVNPPEETEEENDAENR